MRSAPWQQLSSSAACTSAATRRHAIGVLAAAQLFSSMYLGSDSATCDQRERRRHSFSFSSFQRRVTNQRPRLLFSSSITSKLSGNVYIGGTCGAASATA